MDLTFGGIASLGQIIGATIEQQVERIMHRQPSPNARAFGVLPVTQVIAEELGSAA